MIDEHGLEMRYTQSLDTFFKGEPEKALYEVSELGREIVTSRLGPDVILNIHSAVIKELVGKSDPIAASRLVVDANEVLVSSLMGYAMYYYSFMDMLDIETKKREAAQAELADERNKLKEKTNELKQANQDLMEMDYMKSVFIATTSHELRTPLNSIIGFSSILLEGWIGELNLEQKEQLQLIHVAGKQLLALINDIIDISKIEAGKLETDIQEFSLREVIDEAVFLVNNDIGEKGLDLELEVEDITITSDRRRLLQSLLNLLSNASKFTDKGMITLHAKTINSMVNISVIDTGIGIMPDDIPKLFAPFVRLESSLSAKTSGTGLGLYLTKKLTEDVLGGTVEVTSEYGTGSTFTLNIPMKLEIPDKAGESK